jgi:hypothetical protein
MNSSITISKLRKDYPLCYAELMKQGAGGFSDIYSALDSILHRFGIGVLAHPIHSDRTGKLIGHTSTLKIYPDNPIKRDACELTCIEDFRKFKTLDKAKKVSFMAGLDMLEEYLIRAI